jgi:hypothetical protein
VPQQHQVAFALVDGFEQRFEVIIAENEHAQGLGSLK